MSLNDNADLCDCHLVRTIKKLKFKYFN